MAKDIWEKYRVEIGREIFEIYVDANDVKLMQKYLNGQVEVDDLSNIMDYKDKFITNNLDKITWMDIKDITTESFAWLIVALHVYRQSSFNFGKKPFAVVIQHEKGIAQQLMDVLLDWGAMHRLARTEEMTTLRSKFNPSGTARLYGAAYMLYVAGSHAMAKAMGQLIHLDDVVDA